MSGDPEVTAITALVAALDQLDPTIRARVITWAATRWGVSLASPKPSPKSGAKQAEEKAENDGEAPQFENVSELYDAAAPNTESMRALVVGYWFQVVQKEESFTGRQVNDELKHLGHPLSNVTVAFRVLQKQSSALARQVQKRGTSKQAQKLYRLTEARIRAVRTMLNAKAEEE